MKLDAGVERAATMVKPGMLVSLGGGRHMQQLAQVLAKHKQELRVCSPSPDTRATCQRLGLSLVDEPSNVDLAFDGCDSVDEQLHALKSGGGIHVLEKIYAHASKRYILIVPAERVTAKLNPKIPLTLAVAIPAVAEVMAQVVQTGYRPVHRLTADGVGYAHTPLGNDLVDVFASDWDGISALDLRLRAVNGVVGTSYFADEVSAVLATDAENHVTVKTRGEQ